MKKYLLLLGSAMILAACGATDEPEVSEEASSTSEVLQESSSAVSEVAVVTELPADEIGAGAFNLVNSSGTTETGEPITVLYKPDTVGADFDIRTLDFDGSRLTFVYVDGVYVEKYQFGETWIQFDVPDSILKKEGLHTVSLIQYENDDQSGTIITAKHHQFKVVK